MPAIKHSIRFVSTGSHGFDHGQESRAIAGADPAVVNDGPPVAAPAGVDSEFLSQALSQMRQSTECLVLQHGCLGKYTLAAVQVLSQSLK